jgi:hypothetical protein
MTSSDFWEIVDRGFPQLVGDLEGLFTHCHKAAADHLAQRLGHVRILEICCGVGAITAALSKNARNVVAVDAAPLRIKCAAINVQTYGNPQKVTLQVADAFTTAIWKRAKPDVVVADPFWTDPEQVHFDNKSDFLQTQPPISEIVAMATRLNVRGIVIRLSPFCNIASLNRWEPFELENIFVDGAEKYWFTYFGSVCQKPGSSTSIKFVQMIP